MIDNQFRIVRGPRAEWRVEGDAPAGFRCRGHHNFQVSESVDMALKQLGLEMLTLRFESPNEALVTFTRPRVTRREGHSVFPAERLEQLARDGHKPSVVLVEDGHWQVCW